MSSLVPISHSVTPQPPLNPKEQSGGIINRAWGVIQSAFGLRFQPTIDPKAHWITPKEQLRRLALPITEKVFEVSPLILGLAKLVAEYVGLDEWLTNWYTAYDRLELLPDKMPPLPDNIYQIMYSPCPIYGDKEKGDGESYKIKDTHFLSLISQKFGNIDRMRTEVLRSYGEHLIETCPIKHNPFDFTVAKCRSVLLSRVDNPLCAPFSVTHFVLMTMDVLPESRNKTCHEQKSLVDDLSRKARVRYEIPTLQQSLTATATDMVAKKRYDDKPLEGMRTATIVKKTWRGGFIESFVDIVEIRPYLGQCKQVGVVALRVLE